MPLHDWNTAQGWSGVHTSWLVEINRIIFEELVNAQFKPQSLAYFTEVIRTLGEAGCDAVVLGCTEIPLLVTEGTSPLPTLDSTRLLARAALRKAIE